MIIATGGFEAFEVHSWHEQGLTVRFASTRRVVAAAKRSKKWVVALAVSCAAIALPDAAVEASNSIMRWDSLAPKTRAIAPSLGGAVPDGYWRELMAKMRHWKSVQESQLSGPEPIL